MSMMNATEISHVILRGIYNTDPQFQVGHIFNLGAFHGARDVYRAGPPVGTAWWEWEPEVCAYTVFIHNFLIEQGVTDKATYEIIQDMVRQHILEADARTDLTCHQEEESKTSVKRRKLS